MLVIFCNLKKLLKKKIQNIIFVFSVICEEKSDHEKAKIRSMQKLPDTRYYVLIYIGCLFFYSSPSLSGIKYLQTFIAHTTGNLHLASKNTEQTWKLTFNSKAGWHTQIKDVKASNKCGFLTKQEMLPFSSHNIHRK